MNKRLELCHTDEVACGCALRVEINGLTLAVFNLDGEFHVIDDACTHGAGSLSDGLVVGDRVECNFHCGVFNIRTGEVIRVPPTVPVKTYPVIVEKGKVFIEMFRRANGAQ